MAPSLPFRSRCRNIGTAIAAPAAFSLVATRQTGRDSSVTLLRGDLAGMDPIAAQRHAVTVLDVLAHKWRGCVVDVQVTDADNLPVFVCTSGIDGVARAGVPDTVYSGLRCQRCGWWLRPSHGTTCPICGPAAGGAA